MDFSTFQSLLEKAITGRQKKDRVSHIILLDPANESAFRLFNGFAEGHSDLVLDIYARTLVIHNYADDPTQNRSLIDETIRHLQNTMTWLRAGVLKQRHGATQEQKQGSLLFGDMPDTKIKEHGVWYALNLTMNRDASFYLDTRNLRKWLIENMHDKTVLNTYAYTGSFGVAAMAGRASRVIQVDHSRRFLDLARQSYALNGFPVNPKDFTVQDFFPTISRFKHAKQSFDCVILDPPFFSTTSKGRVDQEHEGERLINKVRPLVNDGGWLVAINNALYVSGRDYMNTLEKLCRDGYMSIRELIPVPEDFVGYDRVGKPITDPAPFNHSTKIAILDMKRK